MALKVQLGRIPVDWVIDPTLVDLAQFRHNVCSSYENDSSLGFLNDTVEFIRDRPFGRVFQAAERGSAEDCLDVGNRTFIGYGTQRDQDRALEYWKRLVDSSHLRHPSTPVSNSIRAQAHSCISNYWFDRRIVSNIEGWNIDSLYRSASNANTAASLGLIAPCVLAVADAAEKAGLRRPEDNRFAGLCTKRFQILRSLWEASDKHKREISEAKRTRDRKVEKTPLAYVCAALGCGIEGTKKAALSRCGGKCPVDKKPSYCSKECQIRDWKRHKPICRPKIPAHSRQREALEVDTPPGPETDPPTTGFWEAGLNPTGMEHRVKIPSSSGEALTVSKTLSPAYMRQMREIWSKGLSSVDEG